MPITRNNVVGDSASPTTLSYPATVIFYQFPVTMVPSMAIAVNLYFKLELLANIKSATLFPFR